MSDAVWFYALGTEQRGPVNESDLANAIHQGEIGPDSLVWRESMEDWALARTSLPGALIPQSWVDHLPRSPAQGSQSGSVGGSASQSYPGTAPSGGVYHPTTFGDSIKTVFWRYTQFSGRARRSEYWWFALGCLIASFVLIAIDFMIFPASVAEVGVLSNIFGLAIFVPSIAVSARRLHDTGRSGWWQLVGLIPLIGLIILIVWLAKKGQPNDNDYGPA